MNINIETTTTQELTSEQVDLLAKYLCGTKLTWSDSGLPIFPVNNISINGISVTMNAAYSDSINALDNIGINITCGKLYIRIFDPEVERVLFANNIGDGTGVTATDVATADISNTFVDNTNIKVFDEFPYFTSQQSRAGSFSGCSNLQRIDISNCTYITNDMFNGCSKLEYFNGDDSIQGVLKISNSVTSIGFNAFYGTKIKVVSDLGHITELRWGTFQSCTELTTVTLPNGLITIAGNAFQSCSSLSTVNLPSSVTTIGADGFNTGSITTVNITDLDAWTNIDFNQQGSTPIKDNTQLLLNGNPVTTYSFPNDRTTIKKYCFYKVKSLTSITIPNSVTSIGERAFEGCSGLTSVTINAVTPPTLVSNAFNSTNNCPIYVPAGSVSAYQSASGWSTHASRIQAIPTT